MAEEKNKILKQAKIEIAERLIKMKRPLEQIMEITELEKEEIEKLK